MKRLMLPIAIVLAVLATAACAGDDDAADAGWTDAPQTTMAAATTTMVFDASPPAAEREAPEGDVDQALGGDGTAPTDANAVVTSLDPAQFGRSIIFTANLEVEVDNIIAAGEQAQSVVAGLGGFLFGQETQTGEYPRSVLTIKVPPESFGDALRRLSGIGELLSQTVFADDVTERVVDLESQITTAEASVARLREFLEDATDVEDLAVLEAELLRRETELERLRGQLRTLEDQVALATIVLVLTEPAPPAPEPAIELLQSAYEGHDGGQTCPGSDRLTIDEGERLTLCYVLTNIGNTRLAEIEVSEPGLDADIKDFLVVQGDLGVPLQPDERLILALEIEADPDDYVAPNLTVTSVDEDGEPTWDPVLIETERVTLDVIEDTSLPGFVDALKAAGSAMYRVLGVIVVVAGGLVPFLWIPLLAAAAWWLWRRRRPGTGTAVPEPPPPEETVGEDAA